MKLTKKVRKEIAAYVRENVWNYDKRMDIALDLMNEWRVPFSQTEVYDAVVDAVCDWCSDYDIDDPDEFVEDMDDFLEGPDGIIWEE